MIPLTAGRVARRLLTFYDNKPERWTQGWMHNPDRTCFCVLGALQEILHTEESPENSSRYNEAAGVLREALGRTPACFNDSCVSFYEFKTELKKIARLP
jgi:hypothetical protein